MYGNSIWSSAQVSPFWIFILLSLKKLNLDVSKFLKKKLRRSQCCTLSFCKFLEQNMLYFEPCKKMTKSHKKTKSSFQSIVHCCSWTPKS
jgi:hypothetical protein